MTFGDRVRSLRRERDLTYSALADESFVSRSFLYQLERDESSPTLQTIESLAEAFDLSVLELLEPLYAPMAAEPPFPLTEQVAG